MTPARQLLEHAEALFKPGDEFSFATDDQSEPKAVLIAFKMPRIGYSWVIAIDRAEYTLDRALQLAELFGFHQAAPPPAIERAIHAAAHQPPKDKPHANARPNKRSSRPVARDHKAGAAA